MAKCITCGKRGLFLKVNMYGRCADCQRKEDEMLEKLRIEKEKQKLQKREHDKEIVRQQQEANLFPDLLTSFVVVDLETTGLNTQRDNILELAAIRIIDNNITDKYSSLIWQSNVPNKISEITGITQSDLEKNGHPLKDVIQEFYDFAGCLPLVGHNIKSFDSCFIRRMYDNYGLSFENELVDTLELARKYINYHSYKLTSMKYYLDLYDIKSHRAMGDCEVTLALYRHIYKIAESKPRKKKQDKKPDQKKVIISDRDIEIANYISNAIPSKQYLRFKKRSDGYIDIMCFYVIASIKTEGRIKDFVELWEQHDYKIQNPGNLTATASGKRKNSLRYHFNSLEELSTLFDDLKELYNRCCAYIEEIISYDGNEKFKSDIERYLIEEQDTYIKI